MVDGIRARQLGIDRNITRRDFVNGFAVGSAGAWAATRSVFAGLDGPKANVEAVAAGYPPRLTGLRGSHEGSFEVGHSLRDGAYESLSGAEDSGEVYDLVVVGGGLSGLSGAHFFRQALGNDQTVLILDNHDDFGGHAKRNEFTYEGRTWIGYGGTMSITSPFPFTYAGKALLDDLGIEVDRASEFVDNDVYAGLGSATFFDRETFGADQLVVGPGDSSWDEFFRTAPFSDRARRDLIRIHTDNRDYMAGLSRADKRARLARMSYQEYLLDVANVSQEAIKFFLGRGYRNNKRVDTLPALEAAQGRAPGFDALDLGQERRWSGSSDYRMHFPDGNATIARLLINRLVPAALPGDHDMESVLKAPLRYDRLDEKGANVRMRLDSTVVRVEHEGDVEKADWVRVAYVKDGKLVRVRARNCLLACWNHVVPYLVPDLPQEQKDALGYPVKVPMMYTNVFIKNWRAFKELGVSRLSYPAMYHTSCRLDYPVSMGGYECTQSPDDPIVLHMTRNPNSPGLSRKEQQRAGMLDMLMTPFETIERETRDQLTRALEGGGFDPAEDILAITANRWPHGYAYTYDSLDDPDMPDADRPHVRGRKPLGKIAIANADAGAAAYTNVAIDQADRAVQELMLANGLK